MFLCDLSSVLSFACPKSVTSPDGSTSIPRQGERGPEGVFSSSLPSF